MEINAGIDTSFIIVRMPDIEYDIYTKILLWLRMGSRFGEID